MAAGMNAVVRLARFAGVGVMATLIHYVVLESLFRIWQLLALANVAAFLIACAFSFTVQQRFTFRDRLQGKRLNHRALLLFFCLNAAINWAGGLAAVQFGWYRPLLPLLAAVVNFCSYWLMSSRPMFRA